MMRNLLSTTVALVMSAATAVGYKAYDKGNSMRKFLIITLVIINVACSSNTERDVVYSEPKFREVYAAQLHHLNDELMMRMTDHFMMCDSVIIFPAKNADNNNVFQLLSADNGRLITSFAYLGRSAEELSNYMLMSVDAKRGLLFAGIIPLFVPVNVARVRIFSHLDNPVKRRVLFF